MTSNEPMKKTQSLFDILFRQPDPEDTSRKLNVTTFIGSQIGSVVSFGGVLLRPEVNFKEIFFQRKIWAAGQVGMGFLAGGICGFMYMWTVKQTSKLRGDKDDSFNHFVGAFGGILPYTLMYRRNLTYFVVAGTLGGLFTGIFKIAAQRELVQKQYMHDERVIKVSTHYPEMFVAYEVRKDRLAAKQKLRELAESH